MSSTGRFVVVEGIDGCGKSTQVTLIAERLRAVDTFEPGATALGAALREMLLGDGVEPQPMAEALLIAADRAQHMAEVVEPALRAGRHVVSDRHAASTIAYQGYGRGMPLEDLLVLIELATAGRRPDVTILLDIDPLLAADRRSGRADRFERMADGFFERVREGYLAQAAAEPSRWVVLDGAEPLAVVSAQVDQALDERGFDR